MAEQKLRPCSLFSLNIKGPSLSDAINAFLAVDENVKQKETLAILYSPRRCFLARIAKDNPTVVSSRDYDPGDLLEADLKTIFEARVFNGFSEMRWLNDLNGKHTTAVLSETQLSFAGDESKQDSEVLGAIDQEYLLWGQSTGATVSNWTQFATARIGGYYVPVLNVPDKGYARFKAVEYLKTYEDGNVAVVDERLIGIEAQEEGSNDC